MNEQQQEQEANLIIRDQDANEVLTIKKDGSIFWKVEGEMVKANTDADLGKAFSLCIMELAGMDYKKMLDVYVGEAISLFKNNLMKKLLENPKARTIKKTDFMRAVGELKL